MAKKRIKTEEIETVDTETIKVEIKPKPKTTKHPLKQRLKVGGTWREVGQTIEVTKEGFQHYKSKKII